jgi:hypothetical protein
MSSSVVRRCTPTQPRRALAAMEPAEGWTDPDRRPPRGPVSTMRYDRTLWRSRRETPERCQWLWVAGAVRGACRRARGVPCGPGPTTSQGPAHPGTARSSRDGLAVHVRRREPDQPAAPSGAGWAQSRARPFAPDTIPALAAMAPHARVVTLPAVTHLMPLQDPAGVAGLLANLIAEHARLRRPGTNSSVPDIDTYLRCAPPQLIMAVGSSLLSSEQADLPRRRWEATSAQQRRLRLHAGVLRPYRSAHDRTPVRVSGLQ